MQITINQPELEQAVRNFVVGMGITVPVGDIKFTAARSQGGQIVTEIELSEIDQAEQPAPAAPALEVVPTPASAGKAADDKPLKEEDEPVVLEGDEEASDLPPGQSLFGS